MYGCVCHLGLKRVRCVPVGRAWEDVNDPYCLVGDVLAEPEQGIKDASRVRSRPGETGGENGGVDVVLANAEGVRRNRFVGDECGWIETKLWVSI